MMFMVRNSQRLALLFKAMATTLLLTAAFSSRVEAKIIIMAMAYAAMWIGWLFAYKFAERYRSRSRRLELAVEDAMIYFESEWESVGRHPASRFGREYEYYKEMLYGNSREQS